MDDWCLSPSPPSYFCQRVNEDGGKKKYSANFQGLDVTNRANLAVGRALFLFFNRWVEKKNSREGPGEELYCLYRDLLPLCIAYVLPIIFVFLSFCIVTYLVEALCAFFAPLNCPSPTFLSSSLLIQYSCMKICYFSMPIHCQSTVNPQQFQILTVPLAVFSSNRVAASFR